VVHDVLSSAVVGGSRPASQSKIPLSAEGANEDKVKIDNRRRRLANFTYLARLFDANTPRKVTGTSGVPPRFDQGRVIFRNEYSEQKARHV
jgi:hypothetical protein